MIKPIARKPLILRVTNAPIVIAGLICEPDIPPTINTTPIIANAIGIGLFGISKNAAVSRKVPINSATNLPIIGVLLMNVQIDFRVIVDDPLSIASTVDALGFSSVEFLLDEMAVLVAMDLFPP